MAAKEIVLLFVTIMSFIACSEALDLANLENLGDLADAAANLAADHLQNAAEGLNQDAINQAVNEALNNSVAAPEAAIIPLIIGVGVVLMKCIF